MFLTLMMNLNSDGFLAKLIEEKKTQTIEIPQGILTCPECGCRNLIWDYDTGETICGGCGLVLQEQIMDKGPEWLAFTPEEKASRRRVGVPASYSLHDKGLSTAIDHVDRDAFGRKLPLSTRLQMWRLRKWQIRCRVDSFVERNLAQAMRELDRLSDKAYIPDSVKEKAAVIYRKALDKKLVRGRTIAAIVAASLYVACRTTGTPRSLREIAEASFVDKKDVARCYRLLLWHFKVQVPLADPLTYIPKIATRTGISGQTQGLAIKILQEAKRKAAVAGKDPKGLAAAALYIA
ncbi:transcription initiation factor IIB, partial [Candidatus Bathyarchaeota archaeon]|nr:transcription initiation factor IIB [Candidatus Bathyarchaeota archaeon]